MKNLITLLALSALSAAPTHAATTTIWSCFSKTLSATITSSPPVPGALANTLTVRDLKSNIAMTEIGVLPQGEMEYVGAPIAGYRGGDSENYVTLTITNKGNPSQGYKSVILWHVYGKTTTRNLNCILTANLPPVHPT